MSYTVDNENTFDVVKIHMEFVTLMAKVFLTMITKDHIVGNVFKRPFVIATDNLRMFLYLTEKLVNFFPIKIVVQSNE